VILVQQAFMYEVQQLLGCCILLQGVPDGRLEHTCRTMQGADKCATKWV
jgi:hypothetical protein